MTEQNVKIDGRTRRAADLALAKRTISRASYDALLAGEITLQAARDLGRERGPAGTAQRSGGQRTATGTSGQGSTEDRQGGADTPPQPVSRISKNDTRQACWCGCEQLTSPGKRWRPGHDMRAKGIINRALKEGKAGELSPQLKEYGSERGLI